jgi:outer membrane biosynthesis protein TonB
MIGLLALGVRLVVLAGFTFAFVVLFEHGPAGFAAGAPVEFKNFEGFVLSLMHRNAPEPEPVPAAPAPEVAPAPVPEPVAPTPAPQQAPASTPKPDKPPSAWEKLQSKPIGEGMDIPVAGSKN